VSEGVLNGVRDGLLQLEIFLPPEQKQQVKSKMTGTLLPTELTINLTGSEISLFLSVTPDNGITQCASKMSSVVSR
jgi:hypothetical protein